MHLEMTFSPLQQRAIALFLALIPTACLGLIIFGWISSQVDHQLHVAHLTHQLARKRTLLAQSEQWEDKLQRLRSSKAWLGLFVPPDGNGQPGAAAHLITNAGGTVVSSRSHRMETSGATEIDEAVEFTADIDKLAQIFSGLRRSQPLFVVRELSIRDEEDPNTSDRSVPNALRVEMTVAEFAKP